MFVVTKLDQCPSETLERFRVPRMDPSIWPDGIRESFGESILTSYLPETLRLLRPTQGTKAGNIAPPKWFYSSLQLVAGPEGQRIARRSRIPVGGWEPEYPFEEYRTLIRRLAKLARHLPSSDEAA